MVGKRWLSLIQAMWYLVMAFLFSGLICGAELNEFNVL